MLVDRKKEWNIYKMEVVIRKDGKYLVWKLVGKKSSYKEKSYETVKLENEVIILKLFLEWSSDDHIIGMVMYKQYGTFCKKPHINQFLHMSFE